MCGIAGFSGFRNDTLIKQFSSELVHRGPDGDGFYIDEHISLLSRRLAIIDRAGGDQPIYNEDQTIVVVYNGEIYNYQELREALEAKGHEFKTKSDTEVIVHGYEEWGDNAFDRYNGMFGAALYDIKKKRLLLARDHFGIKPLYYSVLGNSEKAKGKSGLVFSSEIKPILHSGLVQPAVNERTLYRYLKFRIHDDETETFFTGIERLLPGELLVWEQEKIAKHMYSTLQSDIEKSFTSAPKSIDLQKATEEFQTLFVDSVKRRLVSEVPVGTCLSGGLDSSAIAGVVNQLLHEKKRETASVGAKQNTFSAVFPGSGNDEEQYVDAMIGSMSKVSVHKIHPRPSEFVTDLSDFIRTQEEPVISTGPYAQYQVMRKAHDHVTVLLDGQGSDEMMAGYLPYYIVYLRQLIKVKKFLKFTSEMWEGRDVVLHFLKQWITALFSGKKEMKVDELLDNTFVSRHRETTFKPQQNSLKKRLFDDIFRHSLQSLLRYEDRNSMRFSIEGRVPFLDFRLVRFLFSLPDSMIIHQGWNKYILREAIGSLLPDLIRKRRNKIGFTTPEYEWLYGLKDQIGIIFSSDRFAHRPYFNHKQVMEMYRSFVEGSFQDTLLLWRIMNVELWLREFIDVEHGTCSVERRKQIDQNTAKNKKELSLVETSIEVDKTIYKRYLLKTDLFAAGDDFAEKIAKAIVSVDCHPELVSESHNQFGKKWYLIVSEKIIAISQGRSRFIWDIHPSWWAKILSRLVKRTPAGIGLGSPWTMQLAIEEAGLSRILFATFCSMVGKIIGIHGIFYQVAGHGVNAIDGPTSYSLFPSNVSAKLPPKDPQKAAEKIRLKIAAQLLSYSAAQLDTSLRGVEASKRRSNPNDDSVSTKEKIDTLESNVQRLTSHFAGVVIIDANDIGRNVLGNTTDQPDAFFEEVMRDNPMGQGREQTPICIFTM